MSAVMSECGKYRYLLVRNVSDEPAVATFVMLNPSTADAETDDPTIRRCIGFAKDWGCGTLFVVNLFAFRATDPADMRRARDPVGPENDAWIENTVRHGNPGVVVCAWGTHGSYVGRDREVWRRLNQWGVNPLTFGLTKEGCPRHPLRLAKVVRPLPFFMRVETQ